jgi:hypothetical protein
LAVVLAGATFQNLNGNVLSNARTQTLTGLFKASVIVELANLYAIIKFSYLYL